MVETLAGGASTELGSSDVREAALPTAEEKSRDLRVVVFAHFQSANLGDRYQGTGIVSHLEARFAGQAGAPEIVPVNAFPAERALPAGGWEREIAGRIRLVRDPSGFDFAPRDLVVMPTGSLTTQTRFFRTALGLAAERRVRRIVLWGGFSHLIGEGLKVKPLEQALLGTLLGLPEVRFYARSWHDLVLHRILCPAAFGALGGDPLLANDLPDSETAAAGPLEEDIALVTNGNMLLHGRAPDFGPAHAAHKRVFSVDPVADKPLIVRGFATEIVPVNTFERFTAASRSWRRLVSMRLHAGLLALHANPRCDVLFMPPDRPKPFADSFKFHAVGLSASGPDGGLIEVLPDPDPATAHRAFEGLSASDRARRDASLQRYRALTHATLAELEADIAALA